MTPEIDLKPFCEPEDGSRINLQQPFSQGNYTYASDARILIRVPRREGVAEGGPNVGKTTPTLERALAERIFHPLPAYDVIPGEPARTRPCEDCKGSGWVKNCDWCEGTGSGECPTCGHEDDCKECGGRGFFPAADSTEKDAAECDICEASGAIEMATEIPAVARFRDEAGVLPQHDYQLSYIELLKGLPGLEVGFAARHVPFGWQDTGLAFRFEGGCGLVMPRMREERPAKEPARGAPAKEAVPA